MKLAHISTINSLNQISNKSQIEFCLLPVLKNKEYKDYFKKIIKEGKYCIGDNFIAEGNPIPTEKLIKAALEIKVSELIIPDVIGNYNATKKMREDFLSKYYEKMKENNIKLMSVVQGKTKEEYKKCFEEIQNDKRIDVIGIPFRLNFKIFSNKSKELNHMWNRIAFIIMLNVQYKKIKPIHLLGCNLVKELDKLRTFKMIRSCDSKLISRYSLNNQKVNLQDIEKPKIKLYIDTKLTRKQIKLAQENIKILEKIMKGGNE